MSDWNLSWHIVSDHNLLWLVTFVPLAPEAILSAHNDEPGTNVTNAHPGYKLCCKD